MDLQHNRIISINIDRIIVMAPQKDGTYAMRLHGRTGCVFNREDPMGEVTLGVSF